MNKLATALMTSLTLTACGGADDLEHDEAAAEAAFPAQTAAESEFDRIAALPRYRPYASRVRLLPGVGCPDRIADGDEVPFGCLEVLGGRHPEIPDVDVLGDDGVIQFHFQRSSIEPQLASLGAACPVGRQPNGLADVHAEGVRKFVAAGYVRREGQRRYDVLFRRMGDVYKLLPARPLIGGGYWTVVKPGAGVCVPIGAAAQDE